MVQGRKPNLKRRQQVAALRAQGLSLLAIGQAIGVSRQCVQQILRRIEQPPPVRSVTCCGCGRTIVSAGVLPGDRGKALCLPCLEKRPLTPFGQRLKALRLAAGLTQAELADRAGINPSSLSMYEAGRKKPKPSSLDQLIKGLTSGVAQPLTTPGGKRGKRKPHGTASELPTLTSYPS